MFESQTGETAKVGRQGGKRLAQPQGEKVLGPAMACVDGDGPRPGQQEALFMGGLGPVAAQTLTQMLDTQGLSQGPGTSWVPVRCHWPASMARSIQAVFSWTCMRWVSRSAVGSSWASAASANTCRAVRTTVSWSLAK